MSNEPLGIVAERIRDRQLYGDYAYRAPVAAHARSHRITVNCKTGEKTIEAIDTAPKKRRRVEVTAQPELTPLEKAQAEIASLRARLGHAYRQLDLEATITRHAIEDIQKLFCAELGAADYMRGGRPYTIEDLKSPRRSRHMASPRQVCVALVRHLCQWASLPKIGHAFGGRDHTTVMHSCARAPAILEADPILRDVHAKVLAAFEAAK
jgi:hypothetical protein